MKYICSGLFFMRHCFDFDVGVNQVIMFPAPCPRNAPARAMERPNEDKMGRRCR